MFEKLITRLCEKVAKTLPHRHIGDRSPSGHFDLYLARFMLFDGKALGLKWSVMLHHFRRSDSAEELHNHPWGKALSLILTGGYSEERRGRDGMVWRRLFTPGMFNYITDETFHRVDLEDPHNGCWTLFITGERTQSWGFWDRHTKEFTPWRQFVQQEHPVYQPEYEGPMPWKAS